MKAQPWHSLACPTLSMPHGWIDQRGLYYPCDYLGHMNAMDEIQELGCNPDDSYQQVEEKWVKVTTFMDGEAVLLTLQTRLTARQKITIEKLIVKHDLFNKKTNKWFMVADQNIVLEDGKVRFYKI